MITLKHTYFLVTGGELKNKIEDWKTEVARIETARKANIDAAEAALGASALWGDGHLISGASFKGPPPEGWRWQDRFWVPRLRTPEGKAHKLVLLGVFKGLHFPDFEEATIGEQKRGIRFRSDGPHLTCGPDAPPTYLLKTKDDSLVMGIPTKFNWAPPEGVTQLTYEQAIALASDEDED